MTLEDYKGTIAMAASTASFALLLAPSFLCYTIWKKRSSQNVPFYPIMEGLARSILILQQAHIMGITPLIITHAVSIVLNLLYGTVFLFFTDNKSQIKASILKWFLFLMPMIAYANLEKKELVETRYGNLVTTFTVSLMLYHLYNVKRVIKTKSTQDLPFPILVAALCVTFLWALYGVAIKKTVLQLQCGFGFLVCAFQLSLFAIYPRKPPGTKKSQ